MAGRRNGAFPSLSPSPTSAKVTGYTRQSLPWPETTFIHPCSSHCGSMVARFTCIRLLPTASTIERFKTCTHTGRFCSFSVKPGDYRMYPSLDSDRMQFVRGRWRGEGGGIVPWDHDRSVEISRPIMILKGERR